MADQQKVSVNDADARFLELLPVSLSYAYYGSYQPEYLTSKTMAGLNLQDVSPLGVATDPVAFCLDQGYISALRINTAEKDPAVVLDFLSELNSLEGLQEFILLLDSDMILSGIDLPKSLQYVEIQAPSQKLTLPDFTSLADLSVLIIEGQISQLIDLTGNNNLQRLVMKDCSSNQFPPSITKLDRLVWLEYGSSFDELPQNFVNLENIVILELISKKLTELPPNFGQFPKLQHLSLECSNLQDLPASFANLSKLSDLYLWNLQLEEIPSEVFELGQLRYLWYKDNVNFQGSLTKLPDKLGNLIELRDLQLNGHQITELPRSIGNLSNLHTLKLGNNQISQLPETICQLSNLEHLEIYYNPLTHLPELLGDLTKLSSLDISDTKVTELPPTFGNLKNLSSFDAIGCNLKELPDSITNLSPSQFDQFHTSLRLPVSYLSDSIQKWINQLEMHAKSSDDISIEIILYQHEGDQSSDDSPLLETDEIDQLVGDYNNLNDMVRSVLHQALNGEMAHPSLDNILENIPMDDIFVRLDGFEHSMYDLLYHIHFSLIDIINYIQEEDYITPNWPEDYWDADRPSSIPSSEVVQELIDEISAGYQYLTGLLEDDTHDLTTRVPSSSDHTTFREIIIIITHASYHLGQLVLMKKLLSSQK